MSTAFHRPSAAFDQVLTLEPHEEVNKDADGRDGASGGMASSFSVGGFPGLGEASRRMQRSADEEVPRLHLIALDCT